MALSEMKEFRRNAYNSISTRYRVPTCGRQTPGWTDRQTAA